MPYFPSFSIYNVVTRCYIILKFMNCTFMELDFNLNANVNNDAKYPSWCLLRFAQFLRYIHLGMGEVVEREEKEEGAREEEKEGRTRQKEHLFCAWLCVWQTKWTFIPLNMAQFFPISLVLREFVTTYLSRVSTKIVENFPLKGKGGGRFSAPKNK